MSRFLMIEIYFGFKIGLVLFYILINILKEGSLEKLKYKVMKV